MGQQAEAILHETEAHDAHHEMSFWDKYIFSVDHKIIGFQYMFTGLIMAAIGVARRGSPFLWSGRCG